MPSYRYVGFTADGQREQGFVEAESEDKAWEKLAPFGLTIVSLAAEARKHRTSLSSLFPEREISIGAQADVADQLAVLFRSQLPLIEVVRIVSIGASDRHVRRHFNRVLILLADGADFSEAFGRAGNGFAPVFKSLVQLGQSIADPAPILRILATSLRRREKLQTEFNSSLTYPAVLITGALAVFLLVVLYLAPKLEPMFVSVDRPPPATIAFFLWIRGVLVTQGPLLLMAGLVLAVATRIIVLVSPRLFSRIPVLGSLKRTASLARLSRSLHLMLAAGIPLTASLRRAADQSPGEPYSVEFLRAAEAIEAGGTAASAFDAQSDSPMIFKELFGLGERTNSLTGVMDTLATLLEDQVERRTQQLSRLLTPVLTLVVGVLVGTLVYSVMSAILSVNDLAF